MNARLERSRNSRKAPTHYVLRDNRTERRGAVLRAFRGDSAGRGAVPYFPRPRIAKCVSELGFRKMFQTNVDIHKRELSRRGNMRGFWKWICWEDSEWTLEDSGWILDLDMPGKFWVEPMWILLGF